MRTGTSSKTALVVLGAQSDRGCIAVAGFFAEFKLSKNLLPTRRCHVPVLTPACIGSRGLRESRLMQFQELRAIGCLFSARRAELRLRSDLHMQMYRSKAICKTLLQRLSLFPSARLARGLWRFYLVAKACYFFSSVQYIRCTMWPSIFLCCTMSVVCV